MLSLKNWCAGQAQFPASVVPTTVGREFVDASRETPLMKKLLILLILVGLGIAVAKKVREA